MGEKRMALRGQRAYYKKHWKLRFSHPKHSAFWVLCVHSVSFLKGKINYYPNVLFRCSKCPSTNEWIMNIQQMKYNIAIKENAIMKTVGKWMDLDIILQDKDKCHRIFSHPWFLDPNSQRTSSNHRYQKILKEQRLVETRVERAGYRWYKGRDRNTERKQRSVEAEKCWTISTLSDGQSLEIDSIVESPNSGGDSLVLLKLRELNAIQTGDQDMQMYFCLFFSNYEDT